MGKRARFYSSGYRKFRFHPLSTVSALIKYGDRFYRDYTSSSRWTTFHVKVETTDLYIRAERDLSLLARSAVLRLREELREHIKLQDDFLSSLSPVVRIEGVPEVVQLMYEASESAGTGPMAAVAGAIAELTGRELSGETGELIIENGGDIWLRVLEPVRMSIYAGNSMFSEKLCIEITPDTTPMGICCSSGKFGHSTSFGSADAVTVFSADAALADAVATEACNIAKRVEDLPMSVDYAMSVPGITGIITIFGDTLTAKGDVRFV